MAVLTGFFGGCLENVRSSIAGSAAFQTWVGVGSEALAKGRVIRGASSLAGWVRPCVLLDFGDGMRRARSSSDGFELGMGGRLVVMFEASAGAAVESDPQEDLVAFINGVEVVTDALFAAWGSFEEQGGVVLDVRGFQPMESPDLYGEDKPRGRGGGGRPEKFYRWVWVLELGG